MNVTLDDSIQEPHPMLYDLVQIETTRGYDLSPAEHEKLASQFAGALRRLRDFFKKGIILASGALVTKECGIPYDDRQQVVEVVRHPPG